MAEVKSNAASKKRNAALEAMVAEALPEPAEQAARNEQSPPQPAAKPSKTVAKVMVYTHPKVARKFKEIAFAEDRKTNDVILEALDQYLRNAGHRGIKYVIEH